MKKYKFEYMDERNIISVVALSKNLIEIFSKHYHSLALKPGVDISYISDAIERFREINLEATKVLTSSKESE